MHSRTISLVSISLLVLATGCSGSDNETLQRGSWENGGTAAGAMGGNGGRSGSGSGGVSAVGGASQGGSSPLGGTSAGGTNAMGGASQGGSSVVGGAGKGGSSAVGGTNAGGAHASGGVSAGASSARGGASQGGTTSAGGITAGGTNAAGGSPSAGGTGSGTAPEPQSGDLWVSPTGDDSNPGTKESPLKSLDVAVSKVVGGQSIWMTAGTHSFTNTVNLAKSGTSAQPLRLAGAPGGARPILDFSGVDRTSEIRGIQIRGNYWHVRNLEVKNPSDNCINVSGSNNTIELVAVHHCGDTGIQISGTSSLAPANNKVVNCDSYLNADNSAENADGFAAKLVIGPGNHFYGCRAWHNVDDGWDFYDARAVVTLEHCWSFAAKHPTLSTGNSDGNGFKLGGIRAETWYSASPAALAAYPTYQDYVNANSLPHRVTGCFAFNNPATGFDRNNNPSTEITCTDCGAWANGTNFEAGVKIVGQPLSFPSVTPEKAMAALRDANGNLPDIRSLQ